MNIENLSSFVLLSRIYIKENSAIIKEFTVKNLDFSSLNSKIFWITEYSFHLKMVFILKINPARNFEI